MARATHAIRRARPRELPKLSAIERSAGELFREVGLAEVADAEPTAVEVLESALNRRRLWVADCAGEPVGFALATEVDGERHLLELSVRPDHARMGLGSWLLEVVRDEARRLGHRALTLTTYRDVAWNGPFYRRLGFVPVAREDAGPELAKIRQREIDEGLDARPREILRLEIDPG